MLGTRRLAQGASSALCSPPRDVRRWTESRDEFRSLLRKLLREASYLPDAPARSYFHGRIISSFRAYQPPQEASNPQEHPVKRNWNVVKLLRQPGKIERLRVQARQTLSMLAQANAGEFKTVDQVLSLAYGRSGPRRHQLLRPFLNADEPKDDAALLSAIEQSSVRKSVEKPKKAGKAPPVDLGLSSSILALGRAQIAHRNNLQTSDSIRNLYPTTPKENMWGRPMPLRRLRNLKRKIRLNLTQKILPPLPKAEWERLKRLANGEERWEGRSRPKPMSSTESTAASTGNGNKKARSFPVKRRIDQRFMQHRYRTLFVQTPYIIWRPETRKWKAEYGTSMQRVIPVAAPGTLELFGINAAADRLEVHDTETKIDMHHAEAG